MKKQDLIFSNRPKLSIPDKLTYGSRDVAFAPYGDHWRHMRTICVLHLLSAKRVQSFCRVREEETSAMIEKIRAQRETTVNLSDALVELTNDVVCRVAFGRKYDDDGEGRRFKMFLRMFMELLGTSNIGEYISWLAWIGKVDGTDRKVQEVVRLLDEFLEDVLKDHRCKEKQRKGVLDDGDTSDFVDILLEVQRDSRQGSPMGDDTIKALIMDMFAAGTDTTSSILDWTMIELLRNPRTMEKFQTEVRKVSGEITEGDLENMPYLKAVIKESLRLHSPVPLLVARESIQDTKVMGYDIAKGTRVLINAWAIGRDPALWDNPDEFYPERFLDSTTDFRGLHFEFIPFGAGRRGCPGVAFAMAVDELALAKLVQKFDFSLPGGKQANELDMSESVGIAANRKLPLLVAVKAYTVPY